MKNTVGENIARKRKELGWTQEELASRMGYKSKSTINKIELGVNDIPQSKVAKFAEVLRTTPAFIMGWEEKVEADPVGAAELHVEMILDADLVEFFEDFKKLDKKKRQILMDLAKSLREMEA